MEVSKRISYFRTFIIIIYECVYLITWEQVACLGVLAFISSYPSLTSLLASDCLGTQLRSCQICTSGRYLLRRAPSQPLALVRLCRVASLKRQNQVGWVCVRQMMVDSFRWRVTSIVVCYPFRCVILILLLLYFIVIK